MAEPSDRALHGTGRIRVRPKQAYGAGLLAVDAKQILFSSHGACAPSPL